MSSSTAETRAATLTTRAVPGTLVARDGVLCVIDSNGVAQPLERIDRPHGIEPSSTPTTLEAKVDEPQFGMFRVPRMQSHQAGTPHPSSAASSSSAAEHPQCANDMHSHPYVSSSTDNIAPLPSTWTVPPITRFFSPIAVGGATVSTPTAASNTSTSTDTNAQTQAKQ